MVRRLGIAFITFTAAVAISTVALAPPYAAGLSVLGLPNPLGGSPPPALSNASGPTTVGQYQKFEATVSLSPQPSNPYDPSQADLRGNFVGPDGKQRSVPGFWYQAYFRELVNGSSESVKPMGSPTWMVRFAPPVAGTWTWWVSVVTPGGRTSTPQSTFSVTPTSDRGYIGRSAGDPHYMTFSNGTPYFAVGENVAWYDGKGTYDYDNWLNKLAAQGANYAQIDMTTWGFTLEWNDTGIGNYTSRLDRAWRLDYVLSLAEQLGIYTSLALLQAGQYSTTTNPQWNQNPYNAINRGPLLQPGDVFTNATALSDQQRLFRYIIARWGYSTHVMSWQLWGEVDAVSGYSSSASVAWHKQMATFFRSLDPNHLVTTSMGAGVGDHAVWQNSGLDYSQIHVYNHPPGSTSITYPNIASNAHTWNPLMVSTFHMPTLWGEFAVDHTPAATYSEDPHGIALHDGLWGNVVSQAFGTGMTWFWDSYIDYLNYYPMFGSVVRFVAGTPWDQEGFVPTKSTLSSPTRSLVLYGLTGKDRSILWLKNNADQWNTPDLNPVTDGQLVLADLPAGNWCGVWWDTWGGQAAGSVAAFPGGVPTALAVPTFTGDIALKLSTC